MTPPRVIDYLSGWLEHQQEEANWLTAEYAEQGDKEHAAEQMARAAAFGETLDQVRFAVALEATP